MCSSGMQHIAHRLPLVKHHVGPSMTKAIMIDTIIQIPEFVRRRAWECAVDALHARRSTLSADALAFCHTIALRDPVTLTWRECGALLRLHRALFPVRDA